jgi:hypothetical protein
MANTLIPECASTNASSAGPHQPIIDVQDPDWKVEPDVINGYRGRGMESESQAEGSIITN